MIVDRLILRQQLREKRRLLSLNQQQQAALAISEQLKKNSIFTKAQHIAFYFAQEGEANPQPLIETAWQQKKNCYLPIIAEPDNKTMLFAQYHPDSPFKKNRYGIPEPQSELISANKLDLVFVPLVAFDVEGNRLGMGAGFYDATFSFIRKNKIEKPYLIGLAYEFQKVPQIPAKEWDVSLDAIVTEENLYLIQGND